MFHLKFRNGSNPDEFADCQFDTMEEMLSHPRIKCYWFEEANFHQFSLADDSLMVEYKNTTGQSWYIVGRFLYGDTPAWLPNWVPAEYLGFEEKRQ